MGKSFFEKLKKGMDIEKSSSIEEHIEKDLSPIPKKPSSFNNVEDQEQLAKEPSVAEEPSIVLAATKIIPGKKSGGKRKKKEKPADSFAVKRTRQNTKFSAGEEEVTDKKKKIKVKKEPVDVKTITDEKENSSTDEEKKWLGPARQSFASQNLGGPEGQLTVDVYQTDKEIVIQSAVAGIEPDDLDIIIENDMVAIRGNREKLFEEKKRNYFYQECYWGQFSREIILPEEVDNSRAQATMKKGILTIRIPKIESKKKRKINVKE